MSETEACDVFVIGGGVNGCGIARDAAGRGYTVCLAEMNDLASATSSGSTKLVHGGLRYLEHYEFRLVREALREREVLWSIAPHIIRPLRFVLPHHRGLRPSWLLRLGLFLYDHLGGRDRLPASRSLSFNEDAAGTPLKPDFRRGFEYSDCWVDDARLVVLNARDAADRGARIMPRTRVVTARRKGDLWEIETRSPDAGPQVFSARLLVNAAGPWIDEVLTGCTGGNTRRNIRLVKGSHIVVPRLFDHERCYIFQNADGRIVFAIPYERDFTLIGTTDRDYNGDPAKVAIADEEVAYLCEAVNAYFAKPVSPDDIVWSYAAVRALYDDGASKAQEATRDYVLRIDGAPDEVPILNVFGGKITTYRRLAEAACEKIGGLIGPRGRPWTASSPLPGGDFAPEEFEIQVSGLRESFPFLTPEHADRLIRLYGTRAASVLGGAKTLEDLGARIGADLTEAELRYLVDEEWVATAEDVLWRRTKLGLRFLKAEVNDLERRLAGLLTGTAYSTDARNLAAG
jgi:glycerol-3-phosphate dehydrogenase